MSFQCPRCDQTLNNAGEAEGCRDWQCPRGAMESLEVEAPVALTPNDITEGNKL